ncbi:DNA-binding protein SMUBP-2 [Euwallacea similis]|uniref:DNA-binding protein SMUBP-2 n=1 Tax=Euwallacea similis TaxID=1736056 RepID=UPI00344D9A3A
MSSITQTRTENTHVKNKQKELQEATTSKKVDEAIENVKALDNVCTYTKCKTKINLFAIDCKFCKGRFCSTHGLPEVHGCGEAIKREERREYLHPEPKLTKDKHNEVQTKLTMKLKEMQSERKSKQGFQNKGKKKK